MKKIILCVLGSIFAGFSHLCAETLSIPQGVLPESGLNAEFIAKFALFIGILLIWTVGWGKFLKRIVRLPVIAGQIIAGIALGPSGINIAGIPYFAEPVEMIDRASGKLYALASSDLFVFFVFLLSASFTVAYLLWIAGYETNIKDIFKVGISATTAGILGALLPIFATVGVAHWFLGPHYTLISSTGLGLIFAATSVSIPVAMLFAQNKMHLKSSRATLGAAIIDDIFAVVLLSLFFIAVDMGLFGTAEKLGSVGHHTGFIQALLYLFLGFTAFFVLGYFGIRPFINFLQRKKLSYMVAPVANGIMFLYFALAELVGGLAGITGAFFAGLFHRTADTRHYAEKVISPFVNAVLLPLFLCSIGLQVDVKLLNLPQWGVVVLLLFVAIISKLIGCFLATGLANLFTRDAAQRWNMIESYLFGSSMVARGEVGLVVATILYGANIVTPSQYVIAVVVIVLTTITTPIMLSIGFSYQDAKYPEATVPISLNLGIFNVIGTKNLFNIIIGHLEETHNCEATAQFSEGRKIVSLPDYDVKIILCPGEGIMFEGNKKNINRILDMVRNDVMKELERCSAPGSETE